MKLFLVHCGFYDPEVCEGQYEFHVNFFTAAEDAESARKKAKLIPEFTAKKMHIDGLREISAVDGYLISLAEEPTLQGETLVHGWKYRELAPQPIKLT
jgi:hypothetical protein